MNVLQLVTTPRPFFEQQVSVLEERGISCTTVTVPQRDEEGARSPRDYLEFYLRTLRNRPWRYDLIHANYGLTAPAALAQPSRPVVLSLWGSDVYGTYDGVSRRCARLADSVVVMSPGMAEELDRDCTVIPHGVDLSKFSPMPQDEARDALGWRDDAYQVLFPYDPDREAKNHPRARRVVDAVQERVDDVRLQVVSGVPHERIPTYMNAADALLLTSTHEGSPNAVKEALACNTPVVSLAVGDVPALLEGVSPSAVCESDGELVEELERVLRSDETPDGRSVVRPMSLEGMGDRLVSVYREALAERGETERISRHTRSAARKGTPSPADRDG